MGRFASCRATISPIANAIMRLNRDLASGIAPRQIVQVRNIIVLPDEEGYDAPEVDYAVIADKEYDAAPTAADSLALIEVSDTTHDLDRKCKMPLYVHAGAPAWIVHLPLRQVEYYGAVADLEAEHGHVFTERDTFDVLGVPIEVAELLPSRRASA